MAVSERQIGRRQFVKKTVGAVVQIGAFSAIAQRQAVFAEEAGKADRRPPNVVLIMADDLGDVRKDLGAADMPFVIGGSGFGGDNLAGKRLDLLKAQLAMADAAKYPRFKGNVAGVDTRGFWRDSAHSPSNFGYHWNHNGETHFLIGQSMGALMTELLNNKPAAASGGGK